MAFVEPEFSKNQVNRAGVMLASTKQWPDDDLSWAEEVFGNWRASHAYPMNTFQATLRAKLRTGDYADYIVAQRLKRAPSILAKLQRFEGMQLARMQDIGGLRAVVSSVKRVTRLEAEYRRTRFEHELTNSKDYIASPKEDGYRGVHLIYRYYNSRAPAYDGLSLELQLRSKHQHAWATAVETMGTFLGQALKSGQGESQWRDFFTTASAALALVEKSAPVPGYAGWSRGDVLRELTARERSLRVLEKLEGFAIAADQIIRQRGQGAYHLIVLDSAQRTVTIEPYTLANLEAANRDYARVEARTRQGEPVEAVLVAAGPVTQLRAAYPNYFLDTQLFMRQVRLMMSEVPSFSSKRGRGRRSPTKRG